MKIEQYKKGEEIIKEGTHGTWAYIIISGSVEVTTIIDDKKLILSVLNKKQIFGEMGLIEDKPRSATITAKEDTEVKVISRGSFKALFSKDPTVILPIVKALFERLRVASKMASSTCSVCAGNRSADKKKEIIRNDEIKEGMFVAEDNRFIIIEGVNDISKHELKYKPLEVKKFPFKVGRQTSEFKLVIEDVLSNNDFNIKEENPPYYVSRNHFLVDKINGKIVIIDRGSRNGLIVNGQHVEESYTLTEETSEIIIGTSFSPFSFTITIKGEIEYFDDEVIGANFIANQEFEEIEDTGSDEI